MWCRRYIRCPVAGQVAICSTRVATVSGWITDNAYTFVIFGCMQIHPLAVIHNSIKLHANVFTYDLRLLNCKNSGVQNFVSAI